MVNISQHWANWVNQNMPDRGQRQHLFDALQATGDVVVPTNSKKQIEIIKTPTEDFLYPNCPPFVDVHKLIDVYNKLAFRNNLLVKSPKGVGKSLSLTHWCHSTQVPLITVPGSQDSKNRDLIGGFMDLGRFQLGPIPLAIDIANEFGRCVIVFEEINAFTPQTQKTLNSLLDFRKFVTIPQIGKTYRLKPDAQLWCVAMMNPSVYGGTYDLNEDLRSRWIELEIGYPEFGQEKNIVKAHFPTMTPEMDKLVEKFIRLAIDTRQQGTGYALSTRDVVDLVGLLEVMTINEVTQLAVCKFEGEDRDTAIQRVSSSFANIKPRKYWGSKK